MSKGKNTFVGSALQLIAGTKKHFPTASSLTFGSATYTPAQVEASLQKLADLRTAVDDAKTATQAKIAAEQAEAAPLRSQMTAYVAFVKASFSRSPDVLADFGLKPRKANTPLTVEQKAAAAEKRAATRAARHTTGPAAKKKVKGTITTIVKATPSTDPQPVAPKPVATPPSPGAPATGATPHGTP